MILDELIALNPRLRINPRPHCVEVPFQLCPVYFDGAVYGLDWTRPEEIEAYVPRCRNSKIIDASSLRLAYPSLVLYHPGEDGCVLVEQMPEALVREHPVSPSSELGPWAYAVDGWRVYMFARFGQRVLCLMAFDQLVFVDRTGGSDEDQRVLVRQRAMYEGANAPIVLSNIALGNGSLDYELDDLPASNGVAAGLQALNCHGIRQREVLPPRQLRRHAARTGALPPYSYHVLEVRRFVRRPGDGGKATEVWEPLARHWTRGHYKDYREGKGLFGKLRKKYWWIPQEEGRADRIVTKDYAVKEKP